MRFRIYPGVLKAAGLLIILPLVLGAAGCAPAKKASATTVAQEAIVVKTQAVSKGQFDNQIIISGNAAPAEQVAVSARIGGDILWMGADVGGFVKKGQVIARIDDSRYALNREKAGLALSNAQLTLDDKKRDLDRNEQMYTQSAISKKEYEVAQSGYQQTQIGMQLSQNDLKQAELNLRDTSLAAPVSGYVSAKKVNVGESVNAGTLVYTLVDLSRVYIETGVAEEAVNSVKPGMKVQLTVPALAGVAVEGTVDSISPVQDSTKLYGVRIRVDNKDSRLKAGMFATGKINLTGGVDGLAVPKEAVIHTEGKDYVFVKENGKAIRKEVVVGLGSEKQYLIKQGLQEGESVVVVGQEKLQDGNPIKEQK